MMDYYAFWQGFVGLFVILPVVVGACVGAFWAWRKGRRGAGLITAAILGGALLSLCVFASAVLIFRA
jgi:hypothetical protein